MAYREINGKSDLRYLEKGDMVEFKRGVYSHWAIYIGHGQVIHLAGVDGNRKTDKATVAKDDFFEVKGDSKARKNNNKDASFTPANPDTIVKRAEKLLGKKQYHLLFYNCEHFAALCRYGVLWSNQASTFKAVLLVIVPAVAMVTEFIEKVGQAVIMREMLNLIRQIE